MVNKHKQKKKKYIRNYEKSNKEINDLIEMKFQKFVKNKKRRKIEKELQHFQEMQNSNNKSKRNVSSLAENVESGEILSSIFEWKLGSDKFFVTCSNRESENKIGKPKITLIFLSILV